MVSSYIQSIWTYGHYQESREKNIFLILKAGAMQQWLLKYKNREHVSLVTQLTLEPQLLSNNIQDVCHI